MFAKRLLAVALAMSCVHCGGDKPKWREVGPRVEDGYYKADQPEDKNVPLIAIIKRNGSTYSYAFARYECGEETYAYFDTAGMAFSDRPVSPGGKTTYHSFCTFGFEIKAHSPNSIQVIVSRTDENGNTKTTYTLNRIDSETFLQSLREETLKAKVPDLNEKACEESLGGSCQSQGLLAQP